MKTCQYCGKQDVRNMFSHLKYCTMNPNKQQSVQETSENVSADSAINDLFDNVSGQVAGIHNEPPADTLPTVLAVSDVQEDVVTILDFNFPETEWQSKLQEICDSAKDKLVISFRCELGADFVDTLGSYAYRHGDVMCILRNNFNKINQLNNTTFECIK